MSRFNLFITLAFTLGIVSIFAGCNSFLINPHDDYEERMRNAISINPVHELGYIRLAQYLEGKHRYTETFEVLRDAQKHIPESITLIRLEGRLFQGLAMFTEAEKFYTEQIARNPGNALLFLDRAQMNWRIKNHELAIEDARKAQNLNQGLFEAHYLIGVILGQKKGSEDRALEALISASKINSTNPDIWFRISELWLRKGQSKKARLAMHHAVELSPGSNLYLRSYSVLLEKELDEDVHQNSVEISKSLGKSLKHMLKLFPDDSWVQAHFGNWAWTQGKYALAEKHLKRSLELQTIYPWANFRLGVVYFSQEKWKLALELFEDGLKHEPANAWAIQQTGLINEKLNNNEEAISRYEWLMENTPANLFIVNRLNNVYWDEFLFKKGENTLLRGLEKFPGQTELIDKLLSYYESHRLFEKGADILKSFVEKNPENSAAKAKLGFYLKNLKRPEKAIFWFKKAQEISPDFEWAHVQEISILMDSKNDDKAERGLKTFLGINPDSEWALLQMAKLEMKNEQFYEANLLLEKGLKKNNNSLPLLETQGRIFELQERWTESEKIFQRLVTLRPQNSILLTHLALSQWKLNKNEKALKNIIKALYENPGSIWAWNLFLLLQPEKVQLLWIGDEFKSLIPVMHALASRQSEKAWKEITSARTDPFTRQVLKNLYFLLSEAPEEIKMEPQDMSSKELPPWIHKQWGVFHEILGNNQLAALHYEAVLEEFPYGIWIHSRLGWVYERMEKLEKSKNHYSHFLSHYPKAHEVSFRLANVFTMLGAEASTIEIYEKIISERPDHDLVLNNLAWIYLTAEDRRLRDVEKGMQLAKKSVELHPTIDNLDTLAEAYFQSGKQKKAIEVIRRAAKEVNYPLDRHSYLRKQLLRFRKGEPNIRPPSLS